MKREFIRLSWAKIGYYERLQVQSECYGRIVDYNISEIRSVSIYGVQTERYWKSLSVSSGGEINCCC